MVELKVCVLNEMGEEWIETSLTVKDQIYLITNHPRSVLELCSRGWLYVTSNGMRVSTEYEKCCRHALLGLSSTKNFTFEAKSPTENSDDESWVMVE